MGSMSALESIKGVTYQEAFHKAVQEAQYMYGSGGYTGSMAEAGSYEYRQVRAQGLTELEADLYGAGVARKWESTIIMPQLDESTLGRRKKVMVPLEKEVTATLRKYQQAHPEQVLLNALKRDVTAKSKKKPQRVVVKKHYRVRSEYGALQNFDTLAEAKAVAQQQAEQGRHVFLETVSGTEFLPAPREYVVELEVATIIKRTKAHKNSWWAYGVYSC